MEFFAITGMLLMVLIFICMSATILIKKKIYYKYIIKNRDLSLYDYLMDYDGNWFFKEIDYNTIEEGDKDNKYYTLKRQMKIFFWIAVSIFIALLVFGAIMKILNFI